MIHFETLSSGIEIDMSTGNRAVRVFIRLIRVVRGQPFLSFLILFDLFLLLCTFAANN